MSKPNIVLIMCDQMAAQAVGSYGGVSSATPNIDKLSEYGVRFDQFFCNSPMCCPSRASLFSGRYPSDIGVYDNGSEFSASIPTFLHGLKSSGYTSYLSGKAHFVGPDQLHGFDQRLTREIYPASFIWTPDWSKPVTLNQGSNVKQLLASGSCTWSLQLEYDEEVLQNGLSSLRKLAVEQQSNADETPFFLNFSFTHPHDPFIMTEEFHKSVDLKEVSPPRCEWGDTVNHPYNTWINRHHGLDEIDLTDDDVRASRNAYFAACAYIDDCVGIIVKEIERLGLRQNTAVIFTSDHGEMMGEHGMWFKRTFYDEAVRVPFIMSWPGTIRSGQVIDSVHSLVDLFPTLCEIGNVTNDFTSVCGLRGKSILPDIFRTNNDRKDQPVIIEYLGEGTVEPLRSLVSNSHKLVTVRQQPPILFDLQKDAHETTNVATNPEYAELFASLEEQLLKDWNSDDVRSTVLESQARRHAINSAAYDSKPPRWDELVCSPRQGAVIQTNAQLESASNRLPRVSNG